MVDTQNTFGALYFVYINQQCSNWYDFQFSYSFLKFSSFGTNIFRNTAFYMTMMKECVVHCNRPLLSVICACDWMTDLVYLYSRALLGTIILITKYENWQKLELSSPKSRACFCNIRPCLFLRRFTFYKEVYREKQLRLLVHWTRTNYNDNYIAIKALVLNSPKRKDNINWHY